MHMHDMVKIDIIVFENVSVCGGGGGVFRAYNNGVGLEPSWIISRLKYPRSDKVNGAQFNLKKNRVLLGTWVTLDDMTLP